MKTVIQVCYYDRGNTKEAKKVSELWQFEQQISREKK